MPPTARDRPAERRSVSSWTDRRVRAVLLAWLYERLYRELAALYGPVSWIISGGRWRRWQRGVLPFLRGTRILEIGCGPGHLLAILLGAGLTAYGLDRSPAMCRRARCHCRHLATPGRIVQADARAIPFGPASFDSLVLTFPASYLLDPAFWSEAHRVLRRDGRVIVLLGARSETRLWPRLLEEIWQWIGGASSGLHWPPLLPGFRTQSVRLRTPDGTLDLLIADAARPEDKPAQGLT
ncbi:MAG: class I SAM-dependent methyltransferase [Chloroflexi bacterium]|nr:class I SAM-dependent methyltransferase [Chloroflexota bacterium]